MAGGDLGNAGFLGLAGNGGGQGLRFDAVAVAFAFQQGEGIGGGVDQRRRCNALGGAFTGSGGLLGFQFAALALDLGTFRGDAFALGLLFGGFAFALLTLGGFPRGTFGGFGFLSLAAFFGIPGKQGMDGSMVYDAWKAGRIAEILTYCAHDVMMTREVHRALRFGCVQPVAQEPTHVR